MIARCYNWFWYRPSQVCNENWDRIANKRHDDDAIDESIAETSCDDDEFLNILSDTPAASFGLISQKSQSTIRIPSSSSSYPSRLPRRRPVTDRFVTTDWQDERRYPCLTEYIGFRDMTDWQDNANAVNVYLVDDSPTAMSLFSELYNCKTYNICKLRKIGRDCVQPTEIADDVITIKSKIFRRSKKKINMGIVTFGDVINTVEELYDCVENLIGKKLRVGVFTANHATRSALLPSYVKVIFPSSHRRVCTSADTSSQLEQSPPPPLLRIRRRRKRIDERRTEQQQQQQQQRVCEPGQGNCSTEITTERSRSPIRQT